MQVDILKLIVFLTIVIAAKGEPCDVNICHEHAVCTKTAGMYDCTCKTGFTGDSPHLNCADVNECATNPCSTFATCTNTLGSYSCACKTGYTGNGKTCSDDNECLTGVNECSVNANCTNTVGSYTCACNDGFSGDGNVCTDVNECATNPCSTFATCTNTLGSYSCACKTGYTGNGKTCSDDNECLTGVNECSVNAECTNTVGSYTCACNDGFSGDGNICTDVNECATNPCSTFATCTNTLGSYSCACKTGYTGNGKTCSDDNECLTGVNECSVNANCTNTIGSYTCACNDGFSGDGNVCTDIDECSTNISSCSINAICTNTNGSYTCTCNGGFEGDGFSCNEIPECNSHTEVKDGSTITFPETMLGNIAYSNEICSHTGEPLASAVCNGTSENLKFVVTYQSCVKGTTYSSLEEQIYQLQNPTSNFTEVEIDNIISSLRNMANNFNGTLIDEKQLQVLVGLGNNVTEYFLNAQGKNETSFKAFMLMFEKLLTSVKTNETLTTVTTKYIDVGIITNKEVKTYNTSVALINLPSASSETCNKTDCERITVVVYKNTSLFQNTTNQSLTHPVISITIGEGKPVNYLEEPLVLNFKEVEPTAEYSKDPNSLNEKVYVKQCVSDSAHEGNWTGSGCCLVKNTNMCKCTHLTSFALLVDHYQVLKDVTLDTISDIGCCLSIISLAIAIIIQLSDKTVRSHYTSKIYIQLCVNLLVAYVVFVTGVSRTDNELACSSVATLIHYLFLTSFCWMSVYSHSMYMKISQMISHATKKYYILSCCFAYIAPVVVVVLSWICSGKMASDRPVQKYCDGCKKILPTTDELTVTGYRLEHACWIRTNVLYFGFLLPIGMMLVFNVFVFIYIIKSVFWKRMKMKQHCSSKAATREILFVLTMAVIMGLTWIFAYFLLLSSNVTYQHIMSWLFAICNTLQGFLILVISVVRRADIKQQVWMPIVETSLSVTNTLKKHTLTNKKNKYVINVGFDSRKSDIIAYNTDKGILELSKSRVTELTSVSETM